MRTVLLCITLLLSGMLTAQSIDYPAFKVRTGSISNITRIERTPEATKLFIHAIFRPHWWIKEEGDSYLIDAATGIKYPFQKAEGIELNKETYMPASGEMDYVLYFAPLPKTTKSIHLLSPTDSEGNTYDISLTTSLKKKNSTGAIRGNWYRADISNRWEYGIYDSISIIHNRIFVNESIRKKGKSIEVIAKSKEGGATANLLLTPQKDGKYLINLNGAFEFMYTKQHNTSSAVAAEPDFKDFFRKDTAYIQGFIDGYDLRLGLETGLIYSDNTLTREDYPTVVSIHPNGTFDAKLALNYPTESYLSINNLVFPFYIEPGQTLTMYIDWESVLAYSRARNRNLPIENVQYMGPSAHLSYMYQNFNNLINYPYDKLSKMQKQLTPNEFKEQVKPYFSRWDQIRDSLTSIYQPSHKAVHFLKNKIALQKGCVLFEFLMGRDYYAQQDTTNQALKVKEDNSFYEFLRDMPLDDETVIADNNASTFINRFEYMRPLFNRSFSMTQPDSITTTILPKPLLTFLKEKGVKLNSEQEKLRIQQEELAGKTLKRATKDIKKELQITSNLHLTEKELIKEYDKLYLSNRPQPSDEEKDERTFYSDRDEFIQKNVIVHSLSGQPKSFLLQTAMVRQLGFKLKNYTTRKWAKTYIDTLTKQLTYPILIAEVQRILDKIHPENTTLRSYQLPEGKAADIFRNIIKAHAGKMLFVDFWSTSCGSCRSGIEATANLREKYKDHPDFQFIYITNQRESPKQYYDQYVGKNLKGEASYWISETDFHYLRELFKFNGIPHYEFVEKDGSIAIDCPSTWNLQEFLKKRLEDNNPAQ